MPECFAEIEGKPKLLNRALINRKDYQLLRGGFSQKILDHGFFEEKKGFFLGRKDFLLHFVTAIEEQVFWC